jgi:hypothetical protein
VSAGQESTDGMPVQESIYYGSDCSPESCELPVGIYAHAGVAQEDEVHYLFVADAYGVSMLCDCCRWV